MKKLKTKGISQYRVKVEACHTPAKLAQQLRYASNKGIPYVWFPPFDEGGVHEIKEMASGSQTVTTPESWQPEGAH